MTKKIQKNMLLLVLMSVILFSFGVAFLFYDTEKTKAVSTVKNQASLIQTNLKEMDLNTDSIYLDELITQSRITLIDDNGVVFFDNKLTPNRLDNHNDRVEVIEARALGQGEEERYSDSFLQKYYYYAILLEDDVVLRISTHIDSFYSLILMMLPFLLFSMSLIFVLALIIAKRLTHHIIAPIEKADLKSTLTSPYVELDVYFNTMREQKEEISHQMIRVNKRKETINTILNTMQEGFVIVDERLTIFLANQAFLSIMGFNEYQVGQSVTRFIHDEQHLEHIKEALNGKSSSYKFRHFDHIYQVYLSHTRILNEDVAILLFVDISLEHKNQRHREQFSANVSHELKTPLTSIKGLAELQANNLVAQEDIQDFGAKILKQSDRLLELIDHIMRLSKFDEGEIDDTKEDLNLKLIALEVLSHLKEKQEKKNIKLNLDLNDAHFYANAQMMDEMLYNLIENAIKYNDQDGLIELSIKQNDNIIIEITNTGIPIPSKDIPHLFERFYRVDASRDKKTGGTGLGLAIVKHIVVHYQGSIQVQSDEKTHFRITLPNQ